MKKVNIQAIRIREWILVQVGKETWLGLKSTNFKPQTSDPRKQLSVEETNNDENNVSTEISNQFLIHNTAQGHLKEANHVKLCDNQEIRTTPYVEV